MKMQNTLLEIVEKTIRRCGLLAGGEKVLAAVSGGADSACLLDALYQHMAKSRGRMLILPDHRTPVSIKTHSRHPVPFVLWPGESKAGAFSEAEAEATGLRVEEGHRLIEMLFE